MNTKINFKTLIALVFILALSVSTSGPAFGQWSYFTEFNAAYNGNTFGYSGAESSSVFTAGGGLAYSKQNLSAGYSGNFMRYGQLSELDAYAHRGFVTVRSGAFSITGDVSQRLSQESRLYDYTALSTIISSQFGFAGLRWSLAAGGRIYDFVELTERNQHSLLASFRASRSFATRTTIIVSGGLGTTTYTDDAETTLQDESQPSVFQMNGTIRLAQSLSSTTGLAVQYQIRDLNGDTPADYLLEEEGSSYALLDDPSLYSLRTYGLEFTKVAFNHTLSLKMGVYYGERTYLTQGNYTDEWTYDITDSRKDTYHSLWFKAAYDLRFIQEDVSLELGAQLTDNESSSYWYTYDDSYLSLGIGYNF